METALLSADRTTDMRRRTNRIRRDAIDLVGDGRSQRKLSRSYGYKGERFPDLAKALRGILTKAVSVYWLDGRDIELWSPFFVQMRTKDGHP